MPQVLTVLFAVLVKMVSEAGAPTAALLSTPHQKRRPAAATISRHLQYYWFVCNRNDDFLHGCEEWGSLQKPLQCVFTLYLCVKYRTCPEMDYKTVSRFKYWLSSPTSAVDSLLFFSQWPYWHIFHLSKMTSQRLLKIRASFRKPNNILTNSFYVENCSGIFLPRSWFSSAYPSSSSTCSSYWMAGWRSTRRLVCVSAPLSFCTTSCWHHSPGRGLRPCTCTWASSGCSRLTSADTCSSSHWWAGVSYSPTPSKTFVL